MAPKTAARRPAARRPAATPAPEPQAKAAAAPRPTARRAPSRAPAPSKDGIIVAESTPIAIPDDLQPPAPTGIATPEELASAYHRFQPIAYHKQGGDYSFARHLQMMFDHILREKGLVE